MPAPLDRPSGDVVARSVAVSAFVVRMGLVRDALDPEVRGVRVLEAVRVQEGHGLPALLDRPGGDAAARSVAVSAFVVRMGLARDALDPEVRGVRVWEAVRVPEGHGLPALLDRPGGDAAARSVAVSAFVVRVDLVRDAPRPEAEVSRAPGSA
ncbi:hypothetical protein OG885_16275 [Streptomyces sp. NBC_00028]|uniref:hypothetical protein n=1 Tax=Streptomyces sp. NBC_00028 TaxID=2975624 RepID=UPI00324F4355